MPKFDDYTQKTAPEDTDIALILDKTANVNKKTPFSGVWNWIVSKLTSAVISQLETTNKSIVPAINELNSKTKNVIYETKIYPDYSFNTLEDAIKDYVDNHAAIGNSILLVTLRMGSNYMGMVQIYNSNYASAFFIGYSVTTPVYMQKTGGVWEEI